MNTIKYPEKIYAVMWKEELIAARSNKDMAHAYAEGNFGSKTDGICQDNVAIVAYVLLPQYSTNTITIPEVIPNV